MEDASCMLCLVNRWTGAGLTLLINLHPKLQRCGSVSPSHTDKHTKKQLSNQPLQPPNPQRNDKTAEGPATEPQLLFPYPAGEANAEPAGDLTAAARRSSLRQSDNLTMLALRRDSASEGRSTGGGSVYHARVNRLNAGTLQVFSRRPRHTGEVDSCCRSWRH